MKRDLWKNYAAKLAAARKVITTKMQAQVKA